MEHKKTVEFQQFTAAVCSSNTIDKSLHNLGKEHVTLWFNCVASIKYTKEHLYFVNRW